MSNRARKAYDKAVEDIRKLCEERTDLTVCIDEDHYPFNAAFLPNRQLSMFGDKNVDENGEIGSLTITVGLSTSIKSTTKFHVDAALLKKLIRLTEKAGDLYYQAYREAADETAESGEAERSTV